MTHLLAWCVPTEALRWGRLTVEPMDWHLDQLRYAFAEAHRLAFDPFRPVIAEFANVIADAARTFPDIFPIAEVAP